MLCDERGLGVEAWFGEDRGRDVVPGVENKETRRWN